MNTIKADIWSIGRGSSIVIPTNVGWKDNGRNVMGKGLAKDASRRFAWLTAAYGQSCSNHVRAFGDKPMPLVVYATLHSKWCKELILMPTKPIDLTKPYLSWRSKSSIDTITYGLGMLQALASSAEESPLIHASIGTGILLPLIGCGNGGLSPVMVMPIIEEIVTSSLVTLVLPLGTID